MPRVGILALINESNTFLRGATKLEHFRQDVLLAGEAIRQRFIKAHHEIRGFLMDWIERKSKRFRFSPHARYRSGRLTRKPAKR